MLAAALTSVLVLAAPDAEEAQKKLRVAWASQYEWKEHGTKNLTLEFEYEGSYPGPGDEPVTVEGKGQVVIVGDAIVRRHYEGASDTLRERLNGHLDWVVARFMRKPYEEEFKDAELKGPEDLAGGAQRITAGSRKLLLKDDRIVAEERDIGTEKRPYEVRVEFDVGPVGGGYTILGESCGYTRNAVKSMWSRVIEVKDGSEPPVPERYVYKRSGQGGKSDLTIRFTAVQLDLDDPVTMDPAARDLLKQAWERRFTLPQDLKFEGEFSRKGDKDLSKERWGWVSSVRGQFQVWGLDKITVALDPRIADRSWADNVRKTCTEHITDWFKMFRPDPFDATFQGCGFALEETAGKVSVVRIVGHADVAGYKVDGDVIVGRLDQGRAEAWWDYKVKSMRDGRVMVTAMTTELEDKKYTLKFKWTRVRGIDVPKEITALARSAGRVPTRGVAEYSFKKLKVTPPPKD